MSCRHLERQFRLTLKPPYSNQLGPITSAIANGTATMQGMSTHSHGYIEYINPRMERVFHWKCCPFDQIYISAIQANFQVIQMSNNTRETRGNHIPEDANGARRHG